MAKPVKAARPRSGIRTHNGESRSKSGTVPQWWSAPAPSPNSLRPVQLEQTAASIDPDKVLSQGTKSVQQRLRQTDLNFGSATAVCIETR